MKKILIIKSVILIVFSTIIILTSSFKNLELVENNKLNFFNHIKEINKYKENSFFDKNENLDYFINKYNYNEVKQNEENVELSKSILEERTKPYIKKYSKNYNLINSSSNEEDIYIYDKETIEDIIVEYFDKELNDSDLNNFSIINNFDKEVEFVDNYLKIDSLHRNDEFKERLANLYLNKLNQSYNNEIDYVQNDMWNEYESEVKNQKEEDVTYFRQTINGHRDLSNWLDSFSKFLILLVIFLIITTIIATIASGGTFATLGGVLFSKLVAIGFPVVTKTIEIIISIVLSSVVTFPIKALISRNDLEPSFTNLRIDQILSKNKDILIKEYGEDVYKKYEEFFKQGFQNGLGNKFLGIFGAENVKDRAVVIFDQIKNPLWKLNSIDSHSRATYRKWFPFWQSYNIHEVKKHWMNSNKKLTFFTSTLATKGSWTGTYYGDIDNQKENYYDIHWSRNILEHTSLNLVPDFTKKTLSISKSKFIQHQLSTTKNYIKLYKNDKKEFDQKITMDYKTKKIFENYPINETNNFKYISFGKIFK